MVTKLDLRPPRSDAEFAAMMETVDAHLRTSGVKVHARPMQGWTCIAYSLGLTLQLFPAKRPPASGVFHGDDLTLRIFQWFTDRYGDKLKVRPGPGRLPIMIRGEPWEAELPREFGAVVYFASRTERSSKPEEYLRQRVPPRVNVLDQIIGLPDGLRHALSDSELDNIRETFEVGNAAHKAIEAMHPAALIEAALIEQARSDLDISLQCLVHQPRNYPNAKWSAMHACEKVLKEFISRQNGKYRHIHDIVELAADAQAKGMMPLPSQLVAVLTTKPSVRYGEEVVTLGDAYAAHWASITACSHVAINWLSRAAGSRP